MTESTFSLHHCIVSQGVFPSFIWGFLQAQLILEKNSSCLLIQTVKRRLPACAMYLNYGSKLRMANSVLSYLSIFYRGSLKIYEWV
jgi:hypothetical protein